jgi:hypothetical protein
MEELLNLQKKCNITDKDLYVLSKLEDDKKTSSFFEKEKLNAMQRSIISKYKIGFTDKVNIFKTLKKSTFHNDLEQIEKYKGSENHEELNDAGKKGKINFIILFAVFFIVFLTVFVTNNKKTDNSETQRTDYGQNPCEDMESYKQGKSFGRLQRGGIPDCDVYYYEGAASNKDCWCKGFIEGQKE